MTQDEGPESHPATSQRRAHFQKLSRSSSLSFVFKYWNFFENLLKWLRHHPD